MGMAKRLRELLVGKQYGASAGPVQYPDDAAARFAIMVDGMLSGSAMMPMELLDELMSKIGPHYDGLRAWAWRTRRLDVLEVLDEVERAGLDEQLTEIVRRLMMVLPVFRTENVKIVMLSLDSDIERCMGALSPENFAAFEQGNGMEAGHLVQWLHEYETGTGVWAP